MNKKDFDINSPLNYGVIIANNDDLYIANKYADYKITANNDGTYNITIEKCKITDIGDDLDKIIVRKRLGILNKIIMKIMFGES